MLPARIAALLEPFLGPPDDRRLTTNDIQQISTYIDLLLRWNARINLTAIRDPEQIVPRHFGESLFMARHLFPYDGGSEPALETEPAPEGRSILAQPFSAGKQPPHEPSPVGTAHSEASTIAQAVPRVATDTNAADRSQLATRGSKLLRVVDLGSGAGFPALPIKIWAPQIHLTMIESNHKKAAFLREAARALTLTDIDVIAERAESVAARIGEAPTKNPFQPAEVVTFRAVERFTQVLPIATKFLAPNARMAVLITKTQLAELQTQTSMTWTTIHVPKSHNGLLAIGYIKWHK